MTGLRRPAPRQDADSAPFWEGCRRDELLGQRCGNCGRWRWPPREHCPACHVAAPLWEALPGSGTIVGVAVARRVFDPALADESPLPIVHVRLDGTDDEMVLLSNLPAAQWRQAVVGARVTVQFLRVDDDVVLPMFTTDAPSKEADVLDQR